jgi:dipeptidyl aminopeptidase/acylaminoacyl peptidase
MGALDFVLERYSWIDRTRVAAIGASYGGWMVRVET